MIEIKDLYVKYKNTGKVVLDSVSFSVKKGEITAVLGPSGCGKTTLLGAISGVLDAKKDIDVRGEVIFLEKLKDCKIRTVFQNPTLIPWRTVFGNIAYGLEIEKKSKEEIDSQVEKMINLVGLNGTESYYPHEISFGMKQRVNFVRALACNPDILLLDEPFSALDIKTKKNIQREFLKIIRECNITCIFVTHNPEEAFFMAENIMVLSKGPARIKTFIENENIEKETASALEFVELYEE